MEILKFQTKDEAAAAAGEELNNFLQNPKGKPVLLLLSGGSALAILEYVGARTLGENLTISVLDERFSQDREISNFLQIQDTEFGQHAQENNCNFLGTLARPGESKDALAKRFQQALRNWRMENPQGKILATLGIGSDGHTAGIFPYPEDAAKFNRLFNSQNWVTAYDAGGKNQSPERITTTFTFFKEIDEAVVFICGQEKKSKFEALVSKTGQVHELPALGIYAIKHVQVFTDIQ